MVPVDRVRASSY